MEMLANIVLGMLSGAIVTWFDRLDAQRHTADIAARNDLRSRLDRLRTPQGRTEDLIDEALRDHPALEQLAYRIQSDECLRHELAEWLLDPDVDSAAQTRRTLLASLTADLDGDPQPITDFLDHLDRRITAELGALRTDARLKLVFTELRGMAAAARQTLAIAARLQRQLDRIESAQIRALFRPVRPRHSPVTLQNSLLRGERPTDADMDQDLDFERAVMPEVLEAIQAVDRLPAAFLFTADAQRGKTTFLKRLARRLVQLGCPALELADSATVQPYAPCLCDLASAHDRPLILLIDDAARQGENLARQLEHLRQDAARIIILMTSRPGDWERLDDKIRTRLLAPANLRRFDLNPRPNESLACLEQLLTRGIVSLAPEDRPSLDAQIRAIPVGRRYFHRVIQAASQLAPGVNPSGAIQVQGEGDTVPLNLAPTSETVADGLARSVGEPAARLFERLYSLVCLPGMVGLSLPAAVLEVLMPDPEHRRQALDFSSTLPGPPIRMEADDYQAAHEVYAADFLADRDWPSLLTGFLQAFVDTPRIGDFVGSLLEALRNCEYAGQALAAWDAVADRVTTDHWKACSPVDLSFVWGSFFYYTGRTDEALRVVALYLEIDPDDAAAHSNYALLLKTQNRLPEAEDHYRQAVRINPADAGAHNNYAVLLKAQNRHPEAEDHYRQALRIDPEYAEAHYNYADLLAVQKRLAEAQKHYRQGLRMNPEYAHAHNNYANLLAAQNRLPEAEDHYRQALRINPEYAHAHNNYANLLEAQNRLPEAEDHYRQALRINPEYAEVHNSYANLLEAQNHLPEAEDHYRQVLRINPEDAEAHNNYATLLKAQNRLPEAEDHYRHALRIDPECAIAHCNYAVLLAAQNRLSEADEHFLEALRIHPEYAEAHYNCALLLQTQNRLPEAQEHYRQALRINPEDAEAHNNYATLLKAQNRLPEAEGHYRQALRIDPEDACAHNNYADLLEAQDRLPEAEEHYRQALRIDPEDARAQYNYALLLQRQNRLAEAEEHYRQALRIDPECARAHNIYALLLETQSRFAEAEEHYLEVIRIEPENAEAHYDYADLLDTQNRLPEAEDHYREALRINPEYADAHNDFAILLKAQDRLAEAEEHCLEALRINPEDARAHYNYAILLKAQNRLSEAEEHYRQALRINPELAVAHMSYANLLQTQNRMPDAEEHYRHALRIDPEYAIAHYNYANLLEAQNRLPEAEDHYREALRINPELAEALVNLSLLLLTQAQIPEALDLALRAIRTARLPDRGVAIAQEFTDHTEALLAIAESETDPPALHGGALAFLLRFEHPRAAALHAQWTASSNHAAPLAACAEILTLLTP